MFELIIFVFGAADPALTAVRNSSEDTAEGRAGRPSAGGGVPVGSRPGATSRPATSGYAEVTHSRTSSATPSPRPAKAVRTRPSAPISRTSPATVVRSLAGSRWPQLAEQDLLELPGGAEVEGTPGDPRGGGVLHPGGEPPLQLAQQRRVRVDPGPLGAGEQFRQRQLHVPHQRVQAGLGEVGGAHPGPGELGRALGGRAGPKHRPARSAIS